MSVELTRRALSVPRAYDALADERSGGVVVFVGRVRPDATRQGTVRALDYEADEVPALRALSEIEAEARRKFGATRTVLWHRLGRLPVGAASVIVGAAAPHRAEAFEAARYLIERLKQDVPIWKSDRVRPARRPRRPPSPRRRRSAD
jgi:molybdopterin synthase catalytic subunit